MAAGIELARVFVTIMPEASQIAPGMRRITGDVTRQMQSTGKVLGGHLAGSMSTASSQVVRSLKDVEKYTSTVAKANARNKDALGKVRVAQAGLDDLTRRGTVTAKARATAEEALARAQRNQQLTASALTSQTKLLNTAQQQARSARLTGNMLGGSFARVQAEAALTGAAVEARITGGLQRAATRGGGALLGALRSVGTASIAVAGVGGVFAATNVLGGGLERLKTIQDASASMRQLMGDADAARDMVSNVTDLAQGTPYTADQFLNMARNLVAMGTASEQVVPSIEALANAVAASGKGPETLDQLAEAYGKIASQGKITGGEVLSLSQAGVPALRILANTMGVTAEEAKKMVSKSLIPAEQAIDAINKGIMQGTNGQAGETRPFTGVLQQLRETYSGSQMVFQAQEKILAATFLQPLFDRAPKGLNALSDKMKELRPTAQRFGTDLADGIERFISWLSSPGVRSGLGVLRTGLTDVLTAAREMGPGLAAAARTVSLMLTGGGLTAWTLFGETLKSLAPLLNTLAGALGRNQGLVSALGIGVGALYLKSKLLQPAMDGVNAAHRGWAATIGQLRAPLRDVTDRTTGMVTQTGLLTRAQAGLLSPVGQMRLAYLQGAQQAAAFGRSQQLNTQFARDLRSQMVSQLGMWGRFRTAVGDSTTSLRSMQGVMGATRAATTGLKIAGGALLGVMGGPLGIALTAASIGLGFLATRHAEAAAKAEENRRAELALRDALDETTGAMTERYRRETADRLTESGVRDKVLALGLDPHDALLAATADTDAPFVAFRDRVNEAAAANPALAESAREVIDAVFGEMRAFAHAAEAIRAKTQMVQGTFEPTQQAIDYFGQLGAAIKDVPTETTIRVEAPTDEAKQSLEALREKGFDVAADLNDPNLFTLTLSTDEARAAFEGFVQKVEAAQPQIELDADTTRADTVLDAFLGRVNSAGAKVPVTAEGDTTGLFIPRGMPVAPRARGVMYDVWNSVASFANGKLPNRAMIQQPVNGAGLVQWAEPSTHGEAFIPLAPSNRDRSLAIWAETGRRLGAMRSYDRGGLNPGPSYVRDMLMDQYPQITNIGGYRAPDGYGEHDTGNALDVMIPDWNTPQGRALGNAVASFALMNAEALGLTHVLWQQRSFRPGDRTGSKMPDRGDATQNHLDHVHIFMNQNGGQLPTAPLITHGGGGLGMGGAFGRGGSTSAAAARRVRNAQNKVEDTQFRIEQAQQKLEELPDDAKPSRRAAAERELTVAQRAHQDALEDLTAAEMAAAEAQDKKTKGGSSGPDAKSFGQDLFAGLLSGMGFDGELFSDPTQWGITKLGTGIVNLLGNMLVKNLGGDGDGDGIWQADGIPGPGNFGIGDGGFGSGLDGIGGGGGGGDLIGSVLSSVLPRPSSTLPNSQTGGNNYTTNQHSNNTTQATNIFNGSVAISNVTGGGPSPHAGRSNAIMQSLPGGGRR